MFEVRKIVMKRKRKGKMSFLKCGCLKKYKEKIGTMSYHFFLTSLRQDGESHKTTRGKFLLGSRFPYLVNRTIHHHF